jgi:hypothetical protein
MQPTQIFDPTAGHRYFSGDYFNRVWGLLDQAQRTREEDEQMVSMCHASLAHWRDRDDVEAHHLSVGYWQLSRVYAVIGKGTPARRYAMLCLVASAGESPFYQGYGHEALCRAAMLKGELDEARQHLADARAQLALTEDEDERGALATALESLAGDE